MPVKITYADDMTPEDIREVANRWNAAIAAARTGPVVNDEQFAPGYTREAAEYEQATRPNVLQLPVTIPQAIRLHGDITTWIARDRQKLDLLVTMRAGLAVEPDPLSEGLLAVNIADYERLLATLGELLYGEAIK